MSEKSPMADYRTNTLTLAAALDVLAREIESGDGIANAVITEAAERLRELNSRRQEAFEIIEGFREDDGTFTTTGDIRLRDLHNLSDLLNPKEKVSNG